MRKIYVPSSGLEDWQNRLGNPEVHWKDDYSAKLTAESWHFANGFPASITTVFETAGQPFDDLEPLLIFPEHQVPLPPSGARPTQADVWVLAKHQNGLASIAVEGKKNESFGPTLDEWLVGASAGKSERLAFLRDLLRLTADLPGHIRYQFLHRAASAIIEAKRFRASIAVLVVQSFSSNDAGLAEYQEFTNLFGVVAQPSEVVLLSRLEDVSFHVCWVRDASPVRV